MSKKSKEYTFIYDDKSESFEKTNLKQESKNEKYKSRTDDVIRLKKESKKGKNMYICYNFHINADIKSICKEIKTKTGTCGTAKDGYIEIHSDKKEIIRDIIEAKGFKTKFCN